MPTMSEGSLDLFFKMEYDLCERLIAAIEATGANPPFTLDFVASLIEGDFGDQTRVRLVTMASRKLHEALYAPKKTEEMEWEHLKGLVGPNHTN